MAQGFLHGVLIVQGVHQEVLIDRVVPSGALIDREIPSGALIGREVPRADFMTKEDLPAIEDHSGTDPLSRDGILIEAITVATLVLGDSYPGCSSADS